MYVICKCTHIDVCICQGTEWMCWHKWGVVVVAMYIHIQTNVYAVCTILYVHRYFPKCTTL